MSVRLYTQRGRAERKPQRLGGSLGRTREGAASASRLRMLTARPSLAPRELLCFLRTNKTTGSLSRAGLSVRLSLRLPPTPEVWLPGVLSCQVFSFDESSDLFRQRESFLAEFKKKTILLVYSKYLVITVK